MSNHGNVIKFERAQIGDDLFLRRQKAVALACMATDFNKREGRLFAAVEYKTHGFHRETDWINNVQLSELTGIPANHVSEVKKGLIERRILIQNGRQLGINPNTDEWVKTASAKPKKSISREAGIHESGNEKVHESGKNTPHNGCENTPHNGCENTPHNGCENTPHNGCENTPPIGYSESTNRVDGLHISGKKLPDSWTHKRKKETNTKETNTKEKGLDLSVVPDWLNRDTVEDSIDHRKAIKAPMTQAALTRLITKLEKFKQQGIDPNTCLDESIMNGWKSVFEPKGVFAKPKTQRRDFSQVDYNDHEGYFGHDD